VSFNLGQITEKYMRHGIHNFLTNCYYYNFVPARPIRSNVKISFFKTSDILIVQCPLLPQYKPSDDC